MPVITAANADLALVKESVRDAARRKLGLGQEDLAPLVEAGHVLLAVDDSALDRRGPVARDQVRALAAFYPEPRPSSLPADAPDRIFLRAAAFRSGTSPSAALAELVDAWAARAAAHPRLLIAYGGEPWFNRSLLAAGCTLAEEVIFLALSDLIRLPTQSAGEDGAGTSLRLAAPAELNALAALDAACFNIRWHMGVADLRQLQLFGRLTVAEQDGALAGYLALTVNEGIAQIARLAVHPAWAGRGIGRRLLAEGLAAARELGCNSAILNTQTDNSRAQMLYHSFGFRPTGERFEVYTRLAAPGQSRQRI